LLKYFIFDFDPKHTEKYDCIFHKHLKNKSYICASIYDTQTYDKKTLFTKILHKDTDDTNDDIEEPDYTKFCFN